MSDTTSKRDEDDDNTVNSQDPASEAAELEPDDGDDDLDNALFGDDDDVLEASEADGEADTEAAPVEGVHASIEVLRLWVCKCTDCFGSIT